MNGIDIYVEVTHLNFWYGYYGMTEPTSWEDVILYKKVGNDFHKISYFCAMGRSDLADIDYLREDPLKKEFIDKVDAFLEGNEIDYWFYYDNPEDDDFYEVPFEAPRNDKGIKPTSIELWYPSEGIDEKALIKSVKHFCNKFLKMLVDNVLFKEKESFEETLKSYEEDWNWDITGTKVVFTDELVDELMNRWKKSREEVLLILNKRAGITDTPTK